ncbi:glyoxalase [Mycobacterium sp. 1554424.7]|nr:glyoxalase [Mycobacterium sp. 1554424.7]
MFPGSNHRATHWPPHLAPLGGLRFARGSSNFEETVRFYRELVGLPLYETFEASYGSNGAIFGLPSWNLTLEIVESTEPVPVDHGEQLCLYFPDSEAQQAAIARLQAAGRAPVQQHPYWDACGAVTYRDPDGREVVFAPFVFGVNEPEGSAGSGKHEFPPG